MQSLPRSGARGSNLVRESRPENAGHGLGCFAPLAMTEKDCTALPRQSEVTGWPYLLASFPVPEAKPRRSSIPPK